MTAPGEFVFRNAENPTPGESVALDGEEKGAAAQPAPQRNELPPPIFSMDEADEEKFKIWLDQWIQDLENAQANKQRDWAEQEELYRAVTPDKLEFEPFKGACRDVIPAAAMAVDPIHARLDTGIFRQDPVFNFKPLRKSVKDLLPGLAKFVDFYVKQLLKLRQTASPRILECAKLGTMVFKTVYDREEYPVLKYSDDYKQIVPGREVRFAGPRVFGVSLGDFLFPPTYQSIQDCPVAFERQRTTYEKLLVLQAAGKLANVEKIRGQQTVGERTPLEEAREKATNFELRSTFVNETKVYEGWCDYDVNNDGLPEHVVVTYHRDTRTFLQRRLNWYFHQRKPYTLIPYGVANDTLYGLGIVEMARPFQKALTTWQREATNNAILANIRMFIARKGSPIEEVPRLYTGRVFFVDEPSKDFIPFACADIYPSTLAERQNLFGMLEKRTGVSDYLIGRESPVIGTRATATSTLALIQEGSRRVEEVLENLRLGFAEIIQNCVSIWIQYGTGGLEDLIFGDDETAMQVKQFFAGVNQENVNGMFAVELTATDASTTKQAQQQMQLALIQIFMQYLEKLLSAGQGALQAIQMGVPQYAEMVKEVMAAARMMFRDLAVKYSVPNPDDYLPDLEKFLYAQQAPAGPGGGNGAPGQPSGTEGSSGLPVPLGPYRGPTPGRPSTPGAGVGAGPARALAGTSGG